MRGPVHACGSRGHAPPQRTADSILRAASDQRAADVDRQRTLVQLHLHVGTGRLDLDEFAERVDEALAARSIADLAHVLRDLPRLRTESELRAMRQQLVLPYLLVNGILVLVWAITGFGFPWPIFPLAGWGLPVLDQWRRLSQNEPSAVTSTAR